MPTRWKMQFAFWVRASMEMQHRYLLRTEALHGVSNMPHLPEISESTWVSLPRLHTSRSADGRQVSSEIFTRRAEMASNFIQRRKWLWSVGRNLPELVSLRHFTRSS